ncbi:hypothetical protein ACFL5O_04385 [Myxococcota bacterium]
MVRNAAAAALSAVLCRLCVPPCDFWPAALLCWVPLIVRTHAAPLWRALAVEGIQGTLAHLVTFYWTYTALHDVSQFSVPAAVGTVLGLSVFQGLRSALVALAFSRAGVNGWPAMAAFPVALAGTEAVYPMVFPWYTALFVHQRPEWMQLGEFGGPLLVSAWVGVVNAAFASAWMGRAVGIRGIAVPAIVGGTVVGAVTVFGWWRIARVDERLAEAASNQANSVRLGVVQGNLAPARLERSDPVDIYRNVFLEPETRVQALPFDWAEIVGAGVHSDLPPGTVLAT